MHHALLWDRHLKEASRRRQGGGEGIPYTISVACHRHGSMSAPKCQMTHANHHQCTAGCEVKVAWEELYMDCPETFESTKNDCELTDVQGRLG